MGEDSEDINIINTISRHRKEVSSEVRGYY